MTDERIKVSRKHEKEVAKMHKAMQHRGSGSGRRGNDAHTVDELFECKTVLKGKKQITIKADDLRQLAFNAAIEDRKPVLHIYLESAGPQKYWMLVPDVGDLER